MVGIVLLDMHRVHDSLLTLGLAELADAVGIGVPFVVVAATSFVIVGSTPWLLVLLLLL